MNDMQSGKFRAIFAVLMFAAVIFPLSAAQAYIGPGAVVVVLGALFGPVVAIVASVALVALWPARYFYKKWKRKKEGSVSEELSVEDKDKAIDKSTKANAGDSHQDSDDGYGD